MLAVNEIKFVDKTLIINGRKFSDLTWLEKDEIFRLIEIIKELKAIYMYEFNKIINKTDANIVATSQDVIYNENKINIKELLGIIILLDYVIV